MSTTQPNALLPSHTESSDPIPTIPYYAPTVAFDIGLGKKYDYVDFDYKEYAKLAKDLNLSRRATKALSITVKPKVSFGALGVYRPSTHSTDVKAGRGVNNALAHESKHAADFKNNAEMFPGRYAIGSVAMLGLWATLPADAVSLGLSLNSAFSDNDYGLLPVGIMAGVGAVMGAFHYGYTTHPLERSARKAGKNARDVITLHRK